MYHVKTLEVYTITTLEVYTVTTLEVYNVTTLEVYTIKTLEVFCYQIFTGGSMLIIPNIELIVNILYLNVKVVLYYRKAI